MRSENINDEELLFIVAQVDARLFAEGMEMKQRSFQVPITVMREFGYVDVVFAGYGRAPLLDRIDNAYRKIYRPQDLAMGGHIGVYMFRDVFIRVGVPLVYGQIALNPFDHMDLTSVQGRILQFEKGEMQKCIDQFLDVADIHYGIDTIKTEFSGKDDLMRFLRNARFHLHGAAAVLTGEYDHRGAVQSSLLATEMALKAAAVAGGIAEGDLKKKYGHDNLKLLNFICSVFTSIDKERVHRVLSQQPPFVINRYSAEQPKRREAGELAMGAQYISSEIVRQLSNTDIRISNPSAPARAYPA